MDLVPEGDSVAKKRFEDGVKSAATYIDNLAMRRKHRLPEEHNDYITKEWWNGSILYL